MNNSIYSRMAGIYIVTKFFIAAVITSDGEINLSYILYLKILADYLQGSSRSPLAQSKILQWK